MYFRSEVWWWVALALVVVGIAAAILVVAGFTGEHSLGSAVATVVSVSTPALASGARWISGEYAAKGDICRRLLLFHDSLGRPIDGAVARSVALWPRRQLSSATTDPYFASAHSVGPRRLAEDVAESAFFTAELARLTAKFGFVVVGIFIGVPILVCIVFPDIRLLASKQASLVLGALTMLTVGVLLAEVLIHSLHYSRLSKNSLDVFQRGSDIARDDRVPGIDDALQLAEDYSVALARNLPILGWLYVLQQDRIDTAYKQALRES